MSLRYVVNQLYESLLKTLGVSHSAHSNAIWSVLESFSNPFFALLLIPILIQNIGLDQYGQYVMLMAYVSLIGFTGLGMNTSVTYYIAASHSSNDKQSIAQHLATALALTTLGTLSASMIIMTIFSLWHSEIITLTPLLKDKDNLIYLTLPLTVLTQVDLVISAAIKGLQQFKTSSKTELLIRFFNFVIVSLTIIVSESLYATVMCTLVLSGISVSYRFLKLKQVAGFFVSEININWTFAKDLFHFGKWMTLQNIAVALFGSLDKIFIGAILGSRTVGTYNILVAITQLIHFIPANTLTFVMPKVAQNLKLVSLNLLIKMTKIAAAIAGVLAILLCLAKPILFKALAIDFTYSELYYWLIFSNILLSLNVPTYFMALGLNLIRLVAVQCTIGATLGILSIIVLLEPVGLGAAVISKIVYALIALLLFIPIKKISTINYVN